MIEDYKDSEIILCSGIAIDKNYDNVLDVSKSTLVGHLRTHSEYVGNDYSILPRNRNSLIVSCPYQTALKCNYMTFRNPDYENEYVFAFIDTIDYINDEASQINFTLDVWHTYHDKFNVEKVFVEREHVSDDTIGKHTLPENLEHGEYVVSSYLEREFSALGVNGYIIIGLSNLVENFPTPSSNLYNGVYSGLTYYALEDATKCTTFIKALMEAWSYDAANSIYCLFMVPREMFGTGDITWQTGTIGDNTINFGLISSSAVVKNFTSIDFNVGTKIDNYVPKNNRLFCFPYNYIMVSNNCGQTATYNFEDFLDGNGHFGFMGALSIGCSIRLDPLNYKNGFFDADDPSTIIDNRRLRTYGLTCGKFPTCSWNSDSFTNWITTNAVNIGISGLTAAAQIGVGASTGDVMMATEGIGNVASELREVYNHSLIPNQAQGNINSADVLFSSSSLGFSIYRMTIKKEYAAIIDQYLSRYGYKVHEVKTPTLHNRTQFDFIKVGGSDNLISGKIPSQYLNEINAICRRGVTIFHNITNFGNYTISNPIVNP